MEHWFWDSDINFTSPHWKVVGSARTPHGSLRVKHIHTWLHGTMTTLLVPRMFIACLWWKGRSGGEFYPCTFGVHVLSLFVVTYRVRLFNILAVFSSNVHLIISPPDLPLHLFFAILILRWLQFKFDIYFPPEGFFFSCYIGCVQANPLKCNILI